MKTQIKPRADGRLSKTYQSKSEANSLARKPTLLYGEKKFGDFNKRPFSDGINVKVPNIKE